MVEITLLQVKDGRAITEIIKRYPTTPAFLFIQEKVLKIPSWHAIGEEGHKGYFIWQRLEEILQFLEEAVQLNTASTWYI